MIWDKIIGWFGIRTNHHGENWTETDERKLIKLSFKINDNLIAKQLGRTKRAIQQKRYNEKK